MTQKGKKAKPDFAAHDELSARVFGKLNGPATPSEPDVDPCGYEMPSEPSPENEDDDYSAAAIAATAYQILGVLRAPVRILDFFSAVAQGEKPPDPLPFSPDEIECRASSEQVATPCTCWIAAGCRDITCPQHGDKAAQSQPGSEESRGV